MRNIVLLISLVAAFAVACGDAPRKGSPRISCDAGELYDPNTRECVGGGAVNGGAGNAGNNGGNNLGNNSGNNAATNNSSNSSTSNNTSGNNSTANNTTANNTTANNSTSNNSTSNNSTSNNSTSNNSTANNSTSNNSTANNSTSNNTTGGGCSVDTTFYGQIDGAGPHDGGTPTTTSLTVNSGLNAVLAAVPGVPDDPTTLDVDEGIATLSPGLSVTNALVVATGSDSEANVWFWLRDRTTSMIVYLPISTGTTIVVGMRLSFTVNEVMNYNGHPEIIDLSNFTVLGSNAGVPYTDITTRDLTMNDFGKVVRFGGEVMDSGVACGPSTYCYEARSPQGGTATLRTRDPSIGLGSCFTFVGPARSYPGVLDVSAVPQLDVINPRWLQIQ